MEIGTEISQKIRSAIKSKLIDLHTYVDEELPDYIMVMVANRKTETQMNKDLSLFLGDNTHNFTTWLHGLLDRLKSITAENITLTAPDKDEGVVLKTDETTKRKVSVTKENRDDEKSYFESHAKRKQSDASVKKESSERKKDKSSFRSKSPDTKKAKIEDGPDKVSGKKREAEKGHKVDSEGVKKVKTEKLDKSGIAHDKAQLKKSKTHKSPKHKGESAELKPTKVLPNDVAKNTATKSDVRHVPEEKAKKDVKVSGVPLMMPPSVRAKIKKDSVANSKDGKKSGLSLPDEKDPCEKLDSLGESSVVSESSDKRDNDKTKSDQLKSAKTSLESDDEEGLREKGQVTESSRRSGSSEKMSDVPMVEYRSGLKGDKRRLKSQDRGKEKPVEGADVGSKTRVDSHAEGIQGTRRGKTHVMRNSVSDVKSGQDRKATKKEILKMKLKGEYKDKHAAGRMAGKDQEETKEKLYSCDATENNYPDKTNTVRKIKVKYEQESTSYKDTDMEQLKFENSEEGTSYKETNVEQLKEKNGDEETSYKETNVGGLNVKEGNRVKGKSDELKEKKSNSLKAEAVAAFIKEKEDPRKEKKIELGKKKEYIEKRREDVKRVDKKGDDIRFDEVDVRKDQVMKKKRVESKDRGEGPTKTDDAYKSNDDNKVKGDEVEKSDVEKNRDYSTKKNYVDKSNKDESMKKTLVEKKKNDGTQKMIDQKKKSSDEKGGDVAVPELLEKVEHDEFTEEFKLEQQSEGKSLKFVPERSLSPPSTNDGAPKLTSSVSVAVQRKKKYLTRADGSYTTGRSHGRRFTSPLRLPPHHAATHRQAGHPSHPQPRRFYDDDADNRRRWHPDLDDPNRGGGGEVERYAPRSTLGGIQNRAAPPTDIEEEEYDPHNPEVGAVASVIRVTERRKLPKSMQADKTLILKAISDANKSTETRNIQYTMNPVNRVQRDASGKIQLFSRSRRQEMLRPLCKMANTADRSEDIFAFTGMVSDSRQVHVKPETVRRDEPSKPEAADPDDYGGHERRVYAVDSDVSEDSGSEGSDVSDISDSGASDEGAWVEKHAIIEVVGDERRMTKETREHSGSGVTGERKLTGNQRKCTVVQRMDSESERKSDQVDQRKSTGILGIDTKYERKTTDGKDQINEISTAVGGENSISDGSEISEESGDENEDKQSSHSNSHDVVGKVEKNDDKCNSDKESDNNDESDDKTDVDSNGKSDENDDIGVGRDTNETCDNVRDQKLQNAESAFMNRQSAEDQQKRGRLATRVVNDEDETLVEVTDGETIVDIPKESKDDETTEVQADVHLTRKTKSRHQEEKRRKASSVDEHEPKIVASQPEVALVKPQNVQGRLRIKPQVVPEMLQMVEEDTRRAETHGVPEYVPMAVVQDDENMRIVHENNPLVSSATMDDPNTKFIVTLDGVSENIAPRPPLQPSGQRPPPPVMPVRPKRQMIAKVAINLGDSDGDSDNEQGAGTSGRPSVTERCRFWPACNSGDSCQYHHPSSPCRTFPECKFGDKCLFIHPKCRFGAKCSRLDCLYTHTRRPNPSTATNAKYIPSSKHPPFLPEAATTSPVCKFHPSCTNKACTFLHPKVCRFGGACYSTDNCPFYHPQSTRT